MKFWTYDDSTKLGHGLRHNGVLAFYRAPGIVWFRIGGYGLIFNNKRRFPLCRMIQFLRP